MKKSQSIINTQSVMKRMDGNQYFFKALYKIYPKQIKNYMQDIQKALSNNDLKQLALCSHSLESCLQAVGAELCVDANKRLSRGLQTGEMNNITKSVNILKNEIDQFFSNIQKLGLLFDEL